MAPAADPGRPVGFLPEWIHRILSGLRQGGAPRRAATHRSGGLVRVPVLYGGTTEMIAAEVPTLSEVSFRVVVVGNRLYGTSAFPAELGDFVRFWSTCLAEDESRTLPSVTDDEDICLQPPIPFPPNTRSVLVMTQSDWDIVRACTPAAGLPPRP